MAKQLSSNENVEYPNSITGRLRRRKKSFFLIDEKVRNDFISYVKKAKPSEIVQILVIQKDGSARYYGQNLILGQWRPKKKVEKGEALRLADLVDIVEFKIPVRINPGEDFIFFGLVPKIEGMIIVRNPRTRTRLQEECLRVYKQEVAKQLMPNLSAQEVLNLRKKGWFPFIELIPDKFATVRRLFHDPSTLEQELSTFLDEEWAYSLKNRWLSRTQMSFFAGRIDAAVKDFVIGNYCSSILTLDAVIEGVLRKMYGIRPAKEGKNVGQRQLIEKLTNKLQRTHPQDSFLLPAAFGVYLSKFFYDSFNLLTHKIPSSRHSYAHGIIPEADARRFRVMQRMLILDQLWFLLYPGKRKRNG
ncbi:MAG: hypothetical protein U0517_00355 [Candidatus Andersenbacteria bacterium]